MEWLEAEGESVEDAVKAALNALGLDSPDQVSVEVLREAKKGFLGLGSQMALVKVTQPPDKRRSRRRGRGRGNDEGGSSTRSNRSGSGSSSSERSGSPSNEGRGPAGDQEPTSSNDSGRSGDRQKSGADTSSSRKASSDSRSSRSRGGSKQQKNRPNNKPSSQSKRPSQEAAVTDKNGQDSDPKASIEEQGTVAVEFLVGLVDAFGLEGQVTSRIEEDVLYLDVTGDTEALVGSRGVIMQSVLELTRTVVQRKTFGAPRMRLDISGYAERRRTALQIYAARLAEQVIANGGEAMLEAMNPADRKVVHDAISEIDGVRSYSEGEDPERSVIVAAE